MGGRESKGSKISSVDDLRGFLKTDGSKIEELWGQWSQGEEVISRFVLEYQCLTLHRDQAIGIIVEMGQDHDVDMKRKVVVEFVAALDPENTGSVSRQTLKQSVSGPSIPPELLEERPQESKKEKRKCTRSLSYSRPSRTLCRHKQAQTTFTKQKHG
jgi:hypothetical protein